MGNVECAALRRRSWSCPRAAEKCSSCCALKSCRPRRSLGGSAFPATWSRSTCIWRSSAAMTCWSERDLQSSIFERRRAHSLGAHALPTRRGQCRSALRGNPMDSDPSSSRARWRREAAIDWLSRIRTGAMTRADRDAFDAWLAADEANRAAFEKAFALWRDLKGVSIPAAAAPSKAAALAAGGGHARRHAPVLLRERPHYPLASGFRHRRRPIEDRNAGRRIAHRARSRRARSPSIIPTAGDISRFSRAKPGSPWRAIRPGPSSSKPPAGRRRPSAPVSILR